MDMRRIKSVPVTVGNQKSAKNPLSRLNFKKNGRVLVSSSKNTVTVGNRADQCSCTAQNNCD